MAAQSKNKTSKKSTSKKAKSKLGDLFMTALAIICVGGTMLWIAYGIYVDARESNQKIEYKKNLPIVGDSIAHQKVCMASNIYMGSEQMQVPSGEKIYYACSEQCKRKLGTDSCRFAIDPVSHNKVDKALAIVAIAPERSGTIIYFESKDTYRNYLGTLKETERK